MSEKYDGGPAFPGIGDGPFIKGWHVPMAGMSLRDWFAGQALQGFFSGCPWPPTNEEFDSRVEVEREALEKVATLCYRMAQAMLKEREKNVPS